MLIFKLFECSSGSPQYLSLGFLTPHNQDFSKVLYWPSFFFFSDKSVNFYTATVTYFDKLKTILFSSTLHYRYKILYGNYNLIYGKTLSPILSPDGYSVFNTRMHLALAHLCIAVSFSFMFNDG